MENPIPIFAILIGICYIGALWAHYKQASEWPEKLDNILQKIYKLNKEI